jgi:hypothetical protein
MSRHGNPGSSTRLREKEIQVRRSPASTTEPLPRKACSADHETTVNQQTGKSGLNRRLWKSICTCGYPEYVCDSPW